jgi:acetyltransferase-like isoleucine patch superfamily enzyme
MTHDHGQPAQAGAPRPPVSVVILTLNEEVNIRACLESCAWSDDVHVLDSGSQDRTAEIAQEMGVPVHVHPFESFGKQRNWAIDHIPLKHDWVFHLDADERFTPELAEELSRRLAGEPAEAGFYVANKLMFMGRWLRRSSSYPAYQMRLFHKRRMRFQDYGHGQREETAGPLGTLEHAYLHYSFSKGLSDWIEKHNRYSTLEAIQAVNRVRSPVRIGSLVSRDRVERRRTLKEIGYRAPFRPQLRWFVTLFVLGGVLDGRPAWTYAQLQALYERMIALKLRLLRRGVALSAGGFEQDSAPRLSTPVPADTAPARAPANVAGNVSPPTQTRALSAPDPAPINPEDAIPDASPWTFREKVVRATWVLMGAPLFRWSFPRAFGYRAWLLRRFGARVDRRARIARTVKIEVPWNIEVRAGATVGDYAILYSLGRISIGERAMLSPYAHLCAGTHDYTDRRLPLIRDPIEIGAGAWIGPDAFVGPSVRVGRLAVLEARASAYRDLEPSTVYAGNPARPIESGAAP